MAGRGGVVGDAASAPGASWPPSVPPAAAARRTRGATLAAALRRVAAADGGRAALRGRGRWGACCHVVLCGADRRELIDGAPCVEEDLEGARQALGPGVELRLTLCGPQLPPDAEPAAERAGVGVARGCYHECAQFDEAPPQVLLCYNAGVWGYASWAHTVRKAALEHGAAVVVTSYSATEAEEDYDALEAAATDGGGDQESVRAPRCRLRWLWEDEPNGYASLVPREDRGGRDYENSHWQCIVAAEWPGVGA